MAPQPKSVDTSTKSFFTTQIILRMLAAAFTLAAVIVLVTAKQSIVLFGINFEARYDYATAFRFVLGADSVLMMLLVISGCAAGTAVGYVGKFGEDQMGWLKLCDRVTKFCNQVTISMVLSYLAFFCYLAMTVMSPRKFMYQLT